MKLTIELVPQTAWNTNLRSHLKAREWDVVRKKCYKAAGYVCEICGGVGRNHPVECHEIWDFGNGKITLKGLIALCPSCHEVKHIGLASIRGRMDAAKNHLMKVNGIDRRTADRYIQEAFMLYRERSERTDWVFDIEYLSKYLGEI